MGVSETLTDVKKKRETISKELEQYKDKPKLVQSRGRWIPRPKDDREVFLEREMSRLNKLEQITKEQETAMIKRQEHKEDRPVALAKEREKKQESIQTQRQLAAEGKRKEYIQEREKFEDTYKQMSPVKTPESFYAEYKEVPTSERKYKLEGKEYTKEELLSGDAKLPETKKQIAVEQDRIRAEAFGSYYDKQKQKDVISTPIYIESPGVQAIKTTSKKKEVEERLDKLTKDKTQEELLKEGVIVKTTKEDISLAPYRYKYSEGTLKNVLGVKSSKPSSIGAASKETFGKDEILVGVRGGGVVSIGKYDAENMDSGIKYQTDVLKSGIKYATSPIKSKLSMGLGEVSSKLESVGSKWLEVGDVAPDVSISPLVPSPKKFAYAVGGLIAGSSEAVKIAKTAVEYPFLTAATIGTFGVVGAASKAVVGAKASSVLMGGSIVGLQTASFVFNPPKSRFETIERAWDIPIFIGGASAIKQSPKAFRKGRDLFYKDVSVRRAGKIEFVETYDVGKNLRRNFEPRFYESPPKQVRVLGSLGKGLRKVGVPIKGRLNMPKQQQVINVKFQQIIKNMPVSGGVETAIREGSGKYVLGKDGVYDFKLTKTPTVMDSSYKFTGIGETKLTPFKLGGGKSFWEKSVVNVKGYSYVKKGKPTLYPKNVEIDGTNVPIKFLKLKSGLSGYTTFGKNTEIVLSKKLSPTDLKLTLYHEVAHQQDARAIQKYIPGIKKPGKYEFSKQGLKEIENLRQAKLIRDDWWTKDILKKQFFSKQVKTTGKITEEDIMYRKELLADLSAAIQAEPKLTKKLAPGTVARFEQYFKSPSALIKGKYVESPVKVVSVPSYSRSGKLNVFSSRDLPVKKTVIGKRNKGLVVSALEKVIPEKPVVVSTSFTEAVPVKIPRVKKESSFIKSIKKSGGFVLDNNKNQFVSATDKTNKLFQEYEGKGLFGKPRRAWVEVPKTPDIRQVALSRVREQAVSSSVVSDTQRSVLLQQPKVVPKSVVPKSAKPVTSVKVSRAKSLDSGLFYFSDPEYSNVSPLAEQHGFSMGYKPSMPNQVMVSPTKEIFKHIVRRLGVSKPTTSLKMQVGSSILEKQQPLYKPKVSSKAVPRLGVDVLPIVDVSSKVNQKQKISVVPKLKQKFKFKQDTPTPYFPDPFIPNPPPPPPGLPPFGFQFPKLNNMGYKFKVPKGKKRKGKYAPTVFSIGTGFVGKSTAGGVLSGLGLRPLRGK